jgi:hypothetical protein
MRSVTTHKIDGLNEALDVTAIDQPGEGGACHIYTIDGPRNNEDQAEPQTIVFQQGPVDSEIGPNGVSNEALLAILIDRMEGFQRGPFACRENAIALTHLQDAMHWLQHRTCQRVARGVEGTTKL